MLTEGGPVRAAVLVAAAIAIALVLSGCGSDGSPVDASQPPVTAEDVARIKAMLPAQVREDIAENFPIEVPVPGGVVVRGKAQGSEAWDYEIVVDAAPAVLAEWYRQAYTGRSWTVAGEGDAREEASGSTELTLRKGTAECRVTIVPEGRGSRAIAILGVGAPVLQSQ
jgi:hypothetical protein